MKRFSLILLIILLATSLILVETVVVFSQLEKPEISVTPKINQKPPAQEFTINLTITDVTVENGKNGVYGWEVDMSFNAFVLNVTDIHEGPFLKNFWPPEITNTTFSIKIENQSGVGTFVATCFYFPYPDFGGIVYGSETMANITFQVMKKGNSDLNIYKSILNTYFPPPVSRIEPIDHTVEDGYFKYPLGDVSGDGIVDILDVSGISAHWYPGPPIGPLGYDPQFDLNGDGAVDILEVGTVSAYWTGPPKGPLAP